jgi:hypothetical protein
MAITTEQTEQLEFNKLLAQSQTEQSLIMAKHSAKLELLRTAKEVLVENSRSKSIDEREVTAQDIINFANSLQSFIETDS